MWDRERMWDGLLDAGMVDLWVVLHQWHDDVRVGEVITFERLMRIGCTEIGEFIARGFLRQFTRDEWRAWREQHEED